MRVYVIEEKYKSMSWIVGIYLTRKSAEKHGARMTSSNYVITEYKVLA